MSKNLISGDYEPVTVRMWVKATDRTFSEPSVIAFRKSDDIMLAVGNEALRYADDPSEDVAVICPFRNGAVADFDIAATLFKYLLASNYGKALPRLMTFFFRPTVVVCSRFEMTSVETIALRDALRMAGAGNVVLENSSFEEGLRKHGSAAVVMGLE